MRANRTFDDYFRAPAELACFSARDDLSPCSGFFRLGPEVICYGRCHGVPPSPNFGTSLCNLSSLIEFTDSGVLLPCDPDEVVDNLRLERYSTAPKTGILQCAKSCARAPYYWIRPFLRVSVRKHLQRLATADWQHIPFPRWPVDCSVDELMRSLLVLAMKARHLQRVPFVWFWPKDYESAAIVTHDVETAAGLDACFRLMECDESFGIRSSFQLVPEGSYAIPQQLAEYIKCRGFEIAIHDLHHDGTLFRAQQDFPIEILRSHAAHFGANGFRSGALYRDFDCFAKLPFSYDMSVPNVAHLDAQRGGCCTVMPYKIGDLVELPLTTVQDYNLFNILRSYSIELWREQIAEICQNNGLLTILVHPDYLNTAPAFSAYRDLLQYLVEQVLLSRIWLALPTEVAQWWTLRARMRLVLSNRKWEIVGEGSERAQIRYAVLNGDDISYEQGSDSPAPN